VALIAATFEESELSATICGDTTGKEAMGEGAPGSNGLTAISTGLVEASAAQIAGGVFILAGANDNTSGVVAVLNRRSFGVSPMCSNPGVARTDGGSGYKFVIT